jgi:hypothetical protein
MINVNKYIGKALYLNYYPENMIYKKTKLEKIYKKYITDIDIDYNIIYKLIEHPLGTYLKRSFKNNLPTEHKTFI